MYLRVLVICMGVRSLSRVMGKMGMKAMDMSTAQLTRAVQVGMWPVWVRANCTMRSSWGGGGEGGKRERGGREGERGEREKL